MYNVLHGAQFSMYEILPWPQVGPPQPEEGEARPQPRQRVRAERCNCNLSGAFQIFLELPLVVFF